MKQSISPAVGAVVVIIVLAAVLFFGWKKVGPGSKVSTPQSMTGVLGTQSSAPAGAATAPGR